MPIAVTRTYLELSAPDALVRGDTVPAAGVEVARIQPVMPALFRELYSRVGAAYRWRDRDAWTDQEIARRFSGDAVSLWHLTVGGERAGFYELERHEDGSIEIVLFGLVPGFSGRGLGRWMLVDAVDRAWGMGATRVWLHTCTLDSPAALPNYLARGFRPYRTEHYEVAN